MAEVLSGMLRPGASLVCRPGTGAPLTVRALAREGRTIDEARVGQVVLVTFEGAIGAEPGDLLCASDRPAECADQFEAAITASGAQALLAGRKYLLSLGRFALPVTITEIRAHSVGDQPEGSLAKRLEPGMTGVVHLVTAHPIAFDPVDINPATAYCTLLDPSSAQVLGMCELRRGLSSVHDIHLQAVDVDKAARCLRMGQRACIIWFTGLSGAGKSTIANLLEARLYSLGYHTYLLDGDNVRHGLNKDLGFSDADRVENIRRVAEVARLMVDAGLITLVSFISPFRSERRMARALVSPDEFIEVFVDTPLAVAEARDPKGLYRKARRGELRNFTGLDSPYEPPEHAEIHLRTVDDGADEAAQRIIEYLQARGRLRRTVGAERRSDDPASPAPSEPDLGPG